MDRLLSRLERRLGGFALEGIGGYHVMVMGLMWVVEMVRPGVAQRLALIPHRVLEGEVWRLFSFLIIPPSTDLLWGLIIISLYFTVATSLEGQWGAFKFQAFWLIGAVLTAGTCMVTGYPADNSILLMSLFLAFATLFPDFRILLFFVIPIKVKWLGLLDAIALVGMFITMPGYRFVVLAAVGNYLLFFAPELWDKLRGVARVAERSAARSEFKAKSDAVRPSTRKCAKCGITDVDNPRAEFRVCICNEKCGGKPTEFCLEHATNH